MRQMLWIAAIALLSAVSTGCDGSGDGAPDASADIDADTDSDIDADTDTDSDSDPDGGNPDCEIDPDRILDDVTTLAADDWGGREPGTDGNEAAMAMVEDLFSGMGMTPAGDSGEFTQAFEYDAWKLTGEPSVEIGATELEYSVDYHVMQQSGAGTVTEEMIFVGYGMTVPPFDAGTYPDCPLDPAGYDDYEGADLAGKIALVMRHGPDDLQDVHNYCPANAACDSSPCLWSFGYKAANAELHGAAAMILIQDYSEGAAPPAGGGTLGEEYHDGSFPAVFANRNLVEAEAPSLPTWADAIDTTLEPGYTATGVTATVEVAASVQTITSANVIGAFPGTDDELADEVVVIGAHVDHLGTDPVTGDIYNGADDNASGTAVIMELARMLECSGIDIRRTIVLAAWNAEEVGLIGSCHYVSSPTYSMSDTIAAFSVDMVGDGDGSGLAMYGGNEAGNEWIAQVMSGAASEEGLPYYVYATDALDASDHACFKYAGVPAVLLSTLGSHAYYHTPQDTSDTIGVENLEAAARLMWATVKPLAEGTEEYFFTSKGPATTAPASFEPIDPMRPCR